MMSPKYKIGSILIVIFMIVVAWGYLGRGLEIGREDEHAYANLLPLTATAGSLSSFNFETNLKSYTINVPNNILIIKDDIISHNSTLTFDSPMDNLQLLLPPTVDGSFPIHISKGSFEVSFQVTVKEDAGALVSGDEYHDYMRTFTTRYAKRSTGYPHMEQAASYLEQQLKSFKLDTEIQRFQQENRDVLNVIGYHRGINRPEEWVVLGGHYDIKEKTIEGAYDNAAGTVAVLEIAKAISQMKTDRTIVLCLWSGEEQGLWGSEFFVNNIPENVTIKAYLNYDMVGLNWPQVYQLNVLVGPDENGAEVENPELLNVSNRVIDEILRYPSSGFDVKETGEGSSDQVSFWPIGVSTIYFSGLIVYPGYHNKVDDLATMEVLAGGRERLKEGFETVVWVSYYAVILLDNDELIKQKDT
ncbi:MAG: M28 family peptidase [Methanomassiliicoccales archaeon]|nr:MAG: M28 family peptidase [Methanomassiliicoccales archaeon]